MNPRIWSAVLVFSLYACAQSPSSDQAQPVDLSAPTVDLIDPGMAPAVAGEDGWNYHRSAEADLDGDGSPERVVLTARVELYRGRPAWDDGQPWQVYVEAAGGSRTYLYARRLQLGALTLRISAGEPAQVILLEHLPDRLSLYEIHYRQPGQAVAVARYQRTLDPRGELASPQLP